MTLLSLARPGLSVSVSSAASSSSSLSDSTSRVQTLSSIPSASDPLGRHSPDSAHRRLLSSPTPPNLLSHAAAPDTSQISRESLTARPRPWTSPVGVEDDDEDDEREVRPDLWPRSPGGDGNSAAPLESVIPRRTPSFNALSMATNLKHDPSTAGLAHTPSAISSALLSAPLSAAHTPASHEEWRSKILASVRRGEQKVAERRKQSLASLEGPQASFGNRSLSTSTSTKPVLQTAVQGAFSQPQQPGAVYPPQGPRSTPVPKGKAARQDSSPSGSCHPPLHSSPAPGPLPTTPLDIFPHAPSTLPSEPVPPGTAVGHQVSNLAQPSSSRHLVTGWDLSSLDLHSDIFMNTGLLDSPQTHSPPAPPRSSPPSQLRGPDVHSEELPAAPRNPQHRSSGHHTRSSSSGCMSPGAERPRSSSHLSRSHSAQGRVNNASGSVGHGSLDSRETLPQFESDPSTTVLSLGLGDHHMPSSLSLGENLARPAGGASFTPRTPPSAGLAARPPIRSRSHAERSALAQSRGHPSPSSRRLKNGKRNFLSTLLQRASAAGVMSSSALASAPSTSSINSRAFFDPAFARSSSALVPDATAATLSGLDPAAQHDVSRAVIDHPAAAGSSSLEGCNTTATVPCLSKMGLTLTPLTPSLPATRNSQPLCGAILDNKYLLIGTNHGLDFVPLAHLIQLRVGDRDHDMNHSLGTVKPMSLIKKTRFKSLRILEVRSNILLAIAGRNDHLRVYALDGIRAIINKRIQELEEKEEFVWIPRHPGLAKPTGPFKGKGRATRRDFIATVSSPPYSPPPTYPGVNTPHPSQQASVGHVHGLHQPSPGASLRRSSTLGSGVSPHAFPHHLPTFQRRSSFHMGSTAQSSASLPTESPQCQSDSSTHLGPWGLHREPSLTIAPAASTAALTGLDLQDEVTRVPSPTESPHGASLPAASDHSESLAPNELSAIIASKKEKLGRPLFVAQTHEQLRSGVRNGSSETLLDVAPVAKQLANRAGTLQPPTLQCPGIPPPMSRLVPRSPLAADTDEESIDDSNNRVDLVNALADVQHAAATTRPEPQSTPLALTMSAPCRQSDLALRAQHYSGSGSSANLSVPPSLTSEALSTRHSHHSHHSLLAPVANGGALSDPENGTAGLGTLRSKKRWSVIDSVFRAHTSNLSSAISSSVAFSHLSRSAHEDTGLSGPRVGQASSHSDNGAGSNPVIPSSVQATPFTHKSQSAVEGNCVQIPNLSSTDSAGRTFSHSSRQNSVVGNSDGQPRERLATNFHAQVGRETPKTSPHPATLGAPLEYVKLARTKGAKLLRAVETKRRTYLAVLCGEASERIELFTGSKNISLSLNRTFVLPETPRSIEFQMQGDDLVDIYLVYDESVFALEPATVRVREVGIGRNERRAARRERERTARDLASINMRPSAASTAGPVDHDLNGLTNSLSLSSISADPAARTLNETLNLFNQRINQFAVSQVDEGLTLANPTPVQSTPSSSRPGPPGSSGTNVLSNLGTASQPGIGPSHTATTKTINLWPYTTFQQLNSIPPLPPSVLASTFVIPPTYETVISASGGPIAADFRCLSNAHERPPSGPAAHAGTVGETDPSSIRLELPLNRLGTSSSSLSLPANAGPEVGRSICKPEGHANPDSGVQATASSVSGGVAPLLGPHWTPSILVDGPLLSPISLLSTSASRQVGSPGLFLVSRGKKVTSIVDCDGRSVIKKPFLWTNDRNWKPSSHPSEQHGFRIEVIVVDRQRTMMVGIDSSEVKVFEVGGQGDQLEEFSNTRPLDIMPQLIFGNLNLGGNGLGGGGLMGPSASIGIGGGNGVGVMTAESLTSKDSGLGGMHKNTSSPSPASFSAVMTNPSSQALSPSHLGLINREVVFLGACQATNEVIWCERIGNYFGIFSLSGL